MIKTLLTSAIAKPLVIVLLLTTPGFPQGQPKMIEWSKSPKDSKTRTAADMRPLDQINDVEIKDVLIEGKSITMGQSFVAEDDWIQSITFRVKNISEQQLKAVQITLVLPEMSSGSPDIVFCYGCLKTEREKGIAPGEEVELKMPGGSFYGWVREKITTQGDISKISKAQISHVYVTLPDGMKLYSGCLKTADTKNACPHRKPE